MDADSSDFQTFLRGSLAIQLARAANRNAELVLAQSGGNVRMGLRRDVRIDPECDWSSHPQVRSTACESHHLGFALEIEEQDAGLKGRIHFICGLAHPGEDHLSC